MTRGPRHRRLQRLPRRPARARRGALVGLARTRDPVRIRLAGEEREVTPGALGAYVSVFAGHPDLSAGTISVLVDGRRRSFPLGR